MSSRIRSVILVRKVSGSRLTTGSFDHETFDLGLLTTTRFCDPQRHWTKDIWPTCDIWQRNFWPQLTLDYVTFDHGHLTPTDIWPQNFWPQLTFDHRTFDSCQLRSKVPWWNVSCDRKSRGQMSYGQMSVAVKCQLRSNVSCGQMWHSLLSSNVPCGPMSLPPTAVKCPWRLIVPWSKVRGQMSCGQMILWSNEKSSWYIIMWH